MSKDLGKEGEDPPVEDGAEKMSLTESIQFRVQSLEHRRIEISQKVWACPLVFAMVTVQSIEASHCLS